MKCEIEVLNVPENVKYKYILAKQVCNSVYYFGADDDHNKCVKVANNLNLIIFKNPNYIEENI